MRIIRLAVALSPTPYLTRISIRSIESVRFNSLAFPSMYLSLNSSLDALDLGVVGLGVAGLARDLALVNPSESGALRPVVAEPPSGVEISAAVLFLMPECSLVVSKMSLFESELCAPFAVDHKGKMSW